MLYLLDLGGLGDFSELCLDPLLAELLLLRVRPIALDRLVLGGLIRVCFQIVTELLRYPTPRWHPLVERSLELVNL